MFFSLLLPSTTTTTCPSPSQGYNATVDYVVATLRNYTQYEVSVQPFTIESFKVSGTPVLQQKQPAVVNFEYNVDFGVLTYSAAGDLEAPLSAVASLGCSKEDYGEFPRGHIALVMRGDCSFKAKEALAVEYGAVALLVVNNEASGLVAGTLDQPADIPVLGLSNEAGRLLDQSGSAVFKVQVQAEVEVAYTQNVIASSPGGSAKDVVVSGSHLDSVPAGPGINDNGSGSATNLEMAMAFERLQVQPENQVRFLWFGAEELGLLGSKHYVKSLVESDSVRDLAAMVNYDMLGSPNFFRGIYNGSEGASGIRTASEAISLMYVRHFEDQGLAWDPTSFDGRSDYGPFLEVGVPCGGLFTGAEKVKTVAQRKKYGGLANAPYDPCYHQACDTMLNIDQSGLHEMGTAAFSALRRLIEQSDLRQWLANGGDYRLPEHIQPEHVKRSSKFQ
jgi:Zn-dependent M28 family amino/carboxypeptidase